MKKAFSLIMVVILLVGCGFNSKYKELENKMVEGAKEYVRFNDGGYITVKEKPHIIELKELYSTLYIADKLKDPKTNKECNENESYVSVKLVNNEKVYTVHLECGNYITSDE